MVRVFQIDKPSDVTKAFDELIEASNDMQAQSLIAVTKETYRNIIRKWPINTGFSLANHRINVKGGPISIVRPGKRPTEKGSLVGKAGQVHAAEIAKLDRVAAELQLTGRRRSRNITIGNAVSYAGDVGFSFGQGEAIYIEAAREALATVNRMTFNSRKA